MINKPSLVAPFKNIKGTDNTEFTVNEVLTITVTLSLNVAIHLFT